MTFPVYVHGMLKTESYSGVIRPDEQTGVIDVSVPADRRINESRLEVRYSPTLAGAMVDALPYLASYPYGCTEQTLNRFLPTVITQKILQRMGLDLAAIRDKRTNLNAQEIGDPAERAKRWKRFPAQPGLRRGRGRADGEEGSRDLTEMQLSDGGWGWFSGYGRAQRTTHDRGRRSRTPAGRAERRRSRPRRSRARAGMAHAVSEGTDHAASGSRTSRQDDRRAAPRKQEAVTSRRRPTSTRSSSQSSSRTTGSTSRCSGSCIATGSSSRSTRRRVARSRSTGRDR